MPATQPLPNAAQIEVKLRGKVKGQKPLGGAGATLGQNVAKIWLIIIQLVVDYPPMICRHITDSVVQALGDTPVVLVNGARQAGKSTLVQSGEIAGGRQYLTFDDPGV